MPFWSMNLADPGPPSGEMGGDSIFRVGAPGHLDALPLVRSLSQVGGIDAKLSAPRRLARKLQEHEIQAALLPAIDLAGLREPVVILPAGCVASQGRSHIASLFSRRAWPDVQCLLTCDRSRTATVLAKLLLREEFDIRPVMVPCDESSYLKADAMLLTSDGNVPQAPEGYSLQLDLPFRWFEMTGLPFTFYLWAASPDCSLDQLTRRLNEARRIGVEHLADILEEDAPLAGWPDDLASEHLHQLPPYEFTEDHLEGLQEFFERAAEQGLVDRPPKLRTFQA